MIKEKKLKCTQKLFQQAKSEDEDDGPNLARSLKNDIGLTIGSWVSIHCQSECAKTVKEYRGQVTAQDLRNKDRYSVKFVSKCVSEGERYIFPEKDDIEWVDVGQIVEVFHVPEYNGRFFKFV